MALRMFSLKLRFNGCRSLRSQFPIPTGIWEREKDRGTYENWLN